MMDYTTYVFVLYVQSDDFCSWMAGFRMVSKGKQLAKQGYDTEYTAIKNVVALQNRSGGQAAANSEVRKCNAVFEI